MMSQTNMARSFVCGRRMRRREGIRGAAAVEFAIIAPVFFLLVIGFIELGRGLMVQQVLTNASRVGAREAISLHTSATEVKNIAREYAEGVSVPGTLVTVTPDPADVDAGDEITVTVSISYANISWVPAPWFMSNTILSANSVMRKEGFE